MSVKLVPHSIQVENYQGIIIGNVLEWLVIIYIKYTKLRDIKRKP